MAYDPKNNATEGLGALLQTCSSRLAQLYTESGAAQWTVSQAQFELALERSARKRFASDPVSAKQLEEYLETLYLRDLALACGCINGCEAAWECFVRDYRGYLRAAAGAITKGSRAGIQAEEFADSLFAELHGLVEGKRGEHSLLRYFHGRSSLKTWLRAILAQRHVDKIRENRRWEAFDAANGDGAGELPASKIVSPTLDPHRSKYLQRFVTAFEASIGELRPVDRQRLELYYSGQKTLAEIGRVLREHESSSSRNLERTRRELRCNIETHLRTGQAVQDGTDGLAPLSEAEIALCFQYAAEDVPIDFSRVFMKDPPRNTVGEPGELA